MFCIFKAFKKRFFLFLASASMSAYAFAQAPNVQIRNFAASGDGCPPGSYEYLLTPEKEVLQILFSQYTAELAPPGFFISNPPTRSCTISFQMRLPPGLSVSWYRTEHRGFVDTSGGASGQLWARYYLPGEGGFDTVRIYPWGPGTVGAYTVVHDELGAGWTRCGGDRLMTVNTRIRLSGRPNNYNAMTVDDLTERVETALYFQYRSCNDNN